LIRCWVGAPGISMGGRCRESQPWLDNELARRAFPVCDCSAQVARPRPLAPDAAQFNAHPVALRVSPRVRSRRRFRPATRRCSH